MEKFPPKLFLRRYSIKDIKLPFLHELKEAKELFEIIADEKSILPIIVEKDYWIMHCLWGLTQQNIKFDLKGGTSLSKGFDIIERFSEDIDLQIYPSEYDHVAIGKNQDKQSHIESRRNFFNRIASELKISDLKFKRDYSFDEPKKMRGGGIRGEYDSFFSNIVGLKEGIVLELGFDQTVPNTPRDITSWAMKKALSLKINVRDNRAKKILCYLPEYTFVEKLQAVSTKYRLQQINKTMPVNFLRHYYDIYMLLQNERILSFIGSKECHIHKNKRFGNNDEQNISRNPAFTMPDASTRKLYCDEFKRKSSIYFGKQITFEEILSKIFDHITSL